ncbi:solute carrier organic anion transporter family member 3A1 [Caerostris extrusa]|uniref:Solute carrier organic anion transporter family member 3A1 n=1 Tax=Caerostris extrusa TaxID=172846 RepID=A0AAV4MUJ9_CAEEX|nr:solute carrier organic anion transporter family member 3A1 [Caerostris extrusa]
MSAEKYGVMNSMTDEINGCSKLLTGFQDKDNIIKAAMDSKEIKELIENKEAKNLGDDVCYSNELMDTSDECTRKSELSNANKSDDVTSMNTKDVIEKDCPDVISDCRSLENSIVDSDDATELQNSNHSLRNESKLEPSEEHLQKDHLQIPNIPKWLQPWATPKVFLSLYSILGVVSGAYYAYRVGALTTLEKRFAFDSQTSGTIMMVDEITPVLLGPFIGYFGGKTHRPRMFGLGMLISTLCCFVSALPYFLYGPSPHLNIANVKNGTTFEMCDDIDRKENCNADDRPPTIAAVLLLMFAGFLKGFGNIAYHSIGLSYMDDISKKKNTPVYFAVSFSLRLLGPMIGFVMSYYFLKIYENPLDNPGYGPEDPRWIGAWWIGFLLQGILLLMFTLPLALFPRRLRGQKRLPDSDKKRGGSFTGLAAALKRLAKNPLYIAIVINTLMGIFGSVGHFVMLPKYMEHQFRLSASDANLLSGPPGIAAIMLSTILGGYLIWKFKPSTKFLIGAMVLLEAIGAVGYLILMIPKCEKIQMHNFGMDDNGLILDGGCNFNCNCTTKAFSPVCGSDGKTVYFSPCYAGCQESSNKVN